MTVVFLYGAGAETQIFVTGTSGKYLKIFISHQKNQSQLWIPRKPRKIGVWVSGAEIPTSAVDTRTAVWVSTAEKFSKIVLGETRNFSRKFRGVSAPALYKNPAVTKRTSAKEFCDTIIASISHASITPRVLQGRPEGSTTLLHFFKCSRPCIQSVKSMVGPSLINSRFVHHFGLQFAVCAPFQAPLDTWLHSPLLASRSLHGLHFTVYEPSTGLLQLCIKTRPLQNFNSLEGFNLDLQNSPQKLGPWWVARLKYSIPEVQDLQLFHSLGP